MERAESRMDRSTDGQMDRLRELNWPNNRLFNFYPELVKLQQQCQCRILFLILPHNWFYSFFFWERESANISWRQQQENWKEKWKCQSSENGIYIYMFFNHYINLWVFHDISGVQTGETGTTCKKAVFILLFPREIQGIKWKMVISWSEVK